MTDLADFKELSRELQRDFRVNSGHLTGGFQEAFKCISEEFLRSFKAYHRGFIWRVQRNYEVVSESFRGHSRKFHGNISGFKKTVKVETGTFSWEFQGWIKDVSTLFMAFRGFRRQSREF